MPRLPVHLSTSVYIGLLLVACSATDPSPAGLSSGGGGGRMPVGDHAADPAQPGDAAGAAGASGADEGASAGASNGASDAGASDAGAGDAGAGDAGAGASEGGSGNVGGDGASGAGVGGAPAAAGGGGVNGGGTSGADASGAGNTAGGRSNPNDGLMIPCAVNAAYTVCHACHRDPPVNGAPFPLLTLSQHQAAKSLEIADVSSGIMPLGSVLPEAEKNAILDWLTAGAQGVPQAVCP